MAGRLYETTIRLAATISKEFAPEVRKASASMKGFTKEAKQLAATQKKTGDFAKLTKEIAAAEARFKSAEFAEKQLAIAAISAAKATKEETAALRAAQKETKAAERALVRAQRSASKTGEALRKAGVDTSRLSSEQMRLARQIASTERGMKVATFMNHEFGKSIAAVKEKLAGYSTIEGRLSKASGAIRGIAGFAADAVVGVAGIAIGAGTAVYETAKHTAEVGHEIDVTSKKLGTTTEALQLLRFAGKRSGADIEQLDLALGKMAINLGKVIAAKKKGGGGLSGEVGGLQMLGLPSKSSGTEKVDPYKHIGLSAKKLAELQPEEQLVQISDAFGKLKTHSEQAAAAVAIFGKGGLSALPLLLKGGKALQELFDQARASGNLLSKETIENAERFHLASLKMEGSVEGVRNALGAELMPVVTDVMNEIGTFVTGHRADIRAWGKKASDWITNEGVPAFKELKTEIVDGMPKAIETMNELWTITKGIAGAAKTVADTLGPIIESRVEHHGAGEIGVVDTGTFSSEIRQDLPGGGVKVFTDEERDAALRRAGKGGFLYNTLYGDVDKNRDAVIQLRKEHAENKAKAKEVQAEQRKDVIDIGSRVGTKVGGAIGGGGVLLQFSPTYNVGDVPSRDELDKKMDEAHAKAKADALAAYDAREQEKRRVAFD